MKTKDGLQLSYALLPTEDASPDILILKDDGELKVWGKQDFDMWKMHQQFGDFKPQGAKWQHLYITSDTPMKDGDWGIDIGGTEDAEAEIFKFWAKGTEDDDKNDEDFKKIEFTTDPKLIADGVLKIDGETKAYCYPKPDDDIKALKVVNFLEEFCKRYNQKDNQKVDVEKLALLILKKNISTGHSHLSVTEQTEILIKEALVSMKEIYNQALQSNAGCFSLEDIYKAIKLGRNQILGGVEDATSTDDFIQSLTKESQPKRDIVIECDMEKYDVNTPGRVQTFERIKLDKDGQPILTFK